MKRFQKRLLLFAFVVLAPLLDAQVRELGTGAPGPVKAPHLTAELIADPTTIAPRGSGHVALSLTLDPGWHVYWIYAGDAGEPPAVMWSLPQGIAVGPMQYPAPSRLPVGPLMDYGYEGRAVFPFDLSASRHLALGGARLRAHVRWLVCREVCLPGRAYLGLDLKVAPRASAGNNKLIDAAIRAEPLNPPDSVKIDAQVSRSMLTLNIVTGRRETFAEYYPLDDDSIRNAADQTIEPTANGAKLVTERAEASGTIPRDLKGVLTLSGGRSYSFDVPVSATEAQTKPNNEPGFLLAVLFAFGGGIILNLMPCVFPVLFLKALALVGSAGESRRRHLLNGMAYTAGVLCSFWGIVAGLLALRALGRQAGWGFQLQSPGFVLAMIFLLFFMALSLAGMFDLGLTLTGAGDELTRSGGYSGSFFTGVLATVVATPCTAPLMGAAVGYALSQSAVITFAVFTALAIGLALPYLVLTFVPGWAKRMPKPGSWMVTFKQFTSLPLFLTSVWLIWVYGRLSGGAPGNSADHIARLLTGLVVLAVAGWILGQWPTHRWGYVAASVTIALAVIIPLRVAHSDRLQWKPFSADALQAAETHGKPVFVDFTAAWCLSCQVNEKAVLEDGDVEKELLRRHYVLLRADWTHYDPEITATLNRVGRSGVPTYVVFSGTRDGSSHVLPEFPTRNVVLNAIRQTGS
jgi:thiol:disulfide interchange protein DsbD